MYSFLIKQNTELKTLCLKLLPGECLTECITKKIIKISIRNLWFRLIISTKKSSSICSVNCIKSYHCRKDIRHPLRNKFPYSDFFLVRIYPHSNLSGDLLCKSPYSVRIWKNMDQKNSEYEDFLHSDPDRTFFSWFWPDFYVALRKKWSFPSRISEEAVIPLKRNYCYLSRDSKLVK